MAAKTRNQGEGVVLAWNLESVYWCASMISILTPCIVADKHCFDVSLWIRTVTFALLDPHAAFPFVHLFNICGTSAFSATHFVEFFCTHAVVKISDSILQFPVVDSGCIISQDTSFCVASTALKYVASKLVLLSTIMDWPWKTPAETLHAARVSDIQAVVSNAAICSPAKPLYDASYKAVSWLNIAEQEFEPTMLLLAFSSANTCTDRVDCHLARSASPLEHLRANDCTINRRTINKIHWDRPACAACVVICKMYVYTSPPTHRHTRTHAHKQTWIRLHYTRRESSSASQSSSHSQSVNQSVSQLCGLFVRLQVCFHRVTPPWLTVSEGHVDLGFLERLVHISQQQEKMWLRCFQTLCCALQCSTRVSTMSWTSTWCIPHALVVTAPKLLLSFSLGYWRINHIHAPFMCRLVIEVLFCVCHKRLPPQKRTWMTEIRERARSYVRKLRK